MVWLSTKRKRKRPAYDWKSSLPMFCSTTPQEFRQDWTNTQKKRPPSSGGGCFSRRTAAPTGASETFEGKAIVCLHDDDPQWVQGYFLPHGAKKPWGMLGIQEEIIDNCMGCAAEGYRRLTLTVYHNRGNNGNDDGKETNSMKIEGIDWKGGDMMTLYHPHYVDLKAERLLMGKKTLPILNKYFRGLIQRLEQECDIETGVPLLEWLPNVAIVTGSMVLTLPKPKP